MSGKILGYMLGQLGMEFLYLYGSIDDRGRKKAIDAFKTDANKKIMVREYVVIPCLRAQLTTPSLDCRAEVRRPGVEPNGGKPSYTYRPLVEQRPRESGLWSRMETWTDQGDAFGSHMGQHAYGSIYFPAPE
jgi:hypothetical protein